MTVTENARKLSAVLRREGWGGVAERLARRASKRWGGESEPMFLRATDVVDSATVGIPPARPVPTPSEVLTVGWVLTAPGPASGGHTTIFRFVEAIESAGHRCILYLYDGQGGSAQQYNDLIRTWWPRVRAEVRDVEDLGAPGENVDAFVATAWPTAHILAGRNDVPGVRLYLVQDFEPYFYPRGSAYELAEDTYRFGFIPITVGRMVADELRSRFDAEPIVAEFGCDRERYSVTEHAPRDAVIFYAKPGTARRGYELGLMALQLFHQANPAVDIHTFGVTARRLPFPAIVHGHMSPAELNTLYNRCGAGLALSFTNISLIAFELLAAGVTPVVNDSVGTRADLANPHVAWTRPTPRAVAEALEIALASHRIAGPDALAASVADVSWAPAQATVLRAIEEACNRPRTNSPHAAGGRR